MKTLSHVSLTGPRGEQGWGMLSHPRPHLPVGGEFSPVYIPVGEETPPSPSPNRGIPRGESGIGSPLPSLFNSDNHCSMKFDPWGSPYATPMLVVLARCDSSGPLYSLHSSSTAPFSAPPSSTATTSAPSTSPPIPCSISARSMWRSTCTLSASVSLQVTFGFSASPPRCSSPTSSPKGYR
jgi:hypothetical protein